MAGLFNVVATVARDTRGWTRKPPPYFETIGEQVLIKSDEPDKEGMVWVSHHGCRYGNRCCGAAVPLDDLEY